jgi:hypothetical protein
MFENRCNTNHAWVAYWTENRFCAQSCFEHGNGYDGDNCGVRDLSNIDTGADVAFASEATADDYYSNGVGSDGKSSGGMSSVERASLLCAVVGTAFVVMGAL